MRVKYRVSLPALGVLVLFCWTAAGCGGSSEPSGTVEGKVTLNGQPLTEGMVMFSAPEGAPVGNIGPDGSYQLMLAGGTQVPVGEYRVSILPAPVEPDMSGNATAAATAASIPPKYQMPETSGLTASVQQGENQHDFDIQ